MINKTAMAIVSCAMLGAPAFAESQSYGGVSLAFVDYSEQGVEDEAFITVLNGRFGAQFNENLSGEMRVGIGIGEDRVEVRGSDVDVEIDNIYGAYLRAGALAGDVLYPYAIVGYSRGKVTATAGRFSASESESDVSFGIGVDFLANEQVFLSGEYMNYLDKDGVEVSGFSIGLTGKF